MYLYNYELFNCYTCECSFDEMHSFSNFWYSVFAGNDTCVDGLINFEKMRMIGKEVRNICRLCSHDAAQIIPSAVA